jgi:hypothetical protein
VKLNESADPGKAGKVVHSTTVVRMEEAVVESVCWVRVGLAIWLGLAVVEEAVGWLDGGSGVRVMVVTSNTVELEIIVEVATSFVTPSKVNIAPIANRSS